MGKLFFDIEVIIGLIKVSLIMLLFFFFIAEPQAKTIVVKPQTEISSIAQALKLVVDGDTIKVMHGKYYENFLEVDKSITILGIALPEIDAQNKGEIFGVTASGVTIKGFILRGTEVSFLEEYAGIRLEEVSNCLIENNKFVENFFAIYLSKCSDCVIKNNLIEGVGTSESTSGNGIHLWYCKEISIIDNIVSGQRDGIYFEFVENSFISGNLSSQNLRYGLHFMFSDSCEYKDNIFKNNNSGVAVMYSKYVTMTNNQFLFNWGGASYGLLLKDITDSKIEGSIFTSNSIALYMEGCNRINIRDNNFIRNGWAVKIMSNSQDNLFENNNFIGNSFQVSTNSRNNFSTFNKNYWSSYRGYDLNWDGIGDVPYRPVSLFSLVVERYPSTLILLRSLIVDALDLAERAIPSLTPETLVDKNPLMEPVI